MRNRDLYVMIFWMVLGLFVSVWAYAALGIGRIHAPGPGLMPFLLGILFALLAVAQIVRKVATSSGSRIETSDEHEPGQGRTEYRKLLLVMAAMFGFALFLEPLGFLITTFLTMTVLLRFAGFNRWAIAAVYAALIVLVTYFLFTYLGVRFPPGILRVLGLN